MQAKRLKPIENYAREQMSKLGLHGWPHVQRVLHLCIEISKHEKRQLDRDVLEVAALLHDVAKYLEKKENVLDHGRLGGDMAGNFLNSLGFDQDKVKSISHAIRAHTHGEDPRSVEAEILHDADFLDKMGTVGIATVFIKACLANATIEETSHLWKNQSKVSFVGRHLLWLQKPHFYTETARKIAQERNKIVPVFFRQLEKEIELKDFR